MAHRLEEFRQKISADLERSVSFWLKYSHDTEYGGFFNCLSKDGKVYDETKYVWLQARQVWMYCRLYNEDSRYRKQDILDVAVRGLNFLQTHAKNPKTWKCYLTLTRDGKPVKTQRTIFSECFYMMALSEAGKACNNKKFKEEALQMMDKIVHWVRVDDSDLGREKLEGCSPMSILAVPMMLLCLVDQLESVESGMVNKYQDLVDWCLTEVKKHVQRDGTVILENVSPDGKELSGSGGRVMMPGHSIEAGWFLLQMANKLGNDEMKTLAIEKFIVNPFNYGWDEKHGGIYYFMDVDGWPPVQLEWNQKLWWVHNESLIAFLMAYKETKNDVYIKNFEKIFDYSYSRFVDEESGEWYGYLNRQGEVNLSFKGGPWKGCFHVPRYLLMCDQMLRDLCQKK